MGTERPTPCRPALGRLPELCLVRRYQTSFFHHVQQLMSLGFCVLQRLRGFPGIPRGPGWQGDGRCHRSPVGKFHSCFTLSDPDRAGQWLPASGSPPDKLSLLHFSYGPVRLIFSTIMEFFLVCLGCFFI